jgi:hypothetical protein
MVCQGKREDGKHLILIELKNESVLTGKMPDSASHAGNRGSSPRGTTNKENKWLGVVTDPFFMRVISISNPISNLQTKKPPQGLGSMGPRPCGTFGFLNSTRSSWTRMLTSFVEPVRAISAMSRMAEKF